ncbi:Ankyrin repeat domain-containing 52 [Fusarium albosuccineum]|uniref:Ankyrin repeat domain-containing 52 n=1 Tax=Fusarium albosuccineum TaxID=1237068 RepID=A0A8H4P9K6_9HYPO|nr:Ankyrin repeat domain-containing 52 [Fusarium albosuccineum]
MAPQRETFCFTEEFEDGTLEAYSCGKGRFTEGTPNTDYHVCFGVCKAGISLDIQIYDFQLEQWLRTITPLKGDDGGFYASTTMDVLLPYYPALKNKFCVDKRGNQSFDALELFMCDFLQEGSIFGIFGFEHLHEHNILTDVHFHDIQNENYSVSKNFDRLDDLIDEVDEPHFTYPKSLKYECFGAMIRRFESSRAMEVPPMFASDDGTLDIRSLCVQTAFLPPFQAPIKYDFWNWDYDVPVGSLYWAAIAGNLEAVKILLDRGAILEGEDYFISATPLTVAASAGHLNIVRYLVERGANIDGNDSGSPLCRALKDLRIDVIKYLRSVGAKFFAAEFWNTYSKLSAFNQTLVAAVFAGHIVANLSEHERGSLLLQAAGYGYLEIVETLLDHGSDINQKCPWFPLHGVVPYGSADMSLPSADPCGAHYPENLPERCSEVGWYTSLAAALFHNQLGVARYLVRNGGFLTESEKEMRFSASFKFGEIDITPTLCDRLNQIRHCNTDPFESCYLADPSWLLQLEQHELIQRTLSLPTHSNETIDVEACLAAAAIREQERQKLGRRLLAKVKKSRQKILDARNSHSASAGLAAFVDRLGTSSRIWKKGTRTIRNVMDGPLPHDLSDVISSLQVADAMRSAVPPSELVCSKQEFVNDLHRWTVLVNPDEIPLFYEIVSCFWSLTPQAIDANGFSDAEARSFLQELVNNLVAKSGLFQSGYIGSSGTHRLQSLRRRYSSTSHSALLPDSSESSVGSSVLGDPRAHDMPPIEDPKPPDPEQRLEAAMRVTFLMAGAIFGAILIFLCLSRGGWKSPSLHIPDSANAVDWASNQILIRNCFILAMYLRLPFILGPKEFPKPDQGSVKAGDSAHLQHCYSHLWHTGASHILPRLS